MRHTRSDRPPAPPADSDHLRLSDSEREHAAIGLREHAATGRLTMDELAGRLETALAAHTRGELQAVFEDLSAQPPRESNSRARAKALGVRIHADAYLRASLTMVAIWSATGAGYFWPLWPRLGWGIGVASHTGAAGFGPRRARTPRHLVPARIYRNRALVRLGVALLDASFSAVRHHRARWLIARISISRTR